MQKNTIVASTAGKRSLPPKVASMKARKLLKLENGAGAAPGPSAKTKVNGKLRLEDLNWQEVAPPENLDDYEGFFGLEEIDDVEVLKADDGAQVTYKVAANGKKHPAPNGRTVPFEPSSEDEEWEGFEEDDDSLPKPVAQPKRKSKNSKPVVELEPTTFADLLDEDQDDGADVTAWSSMKLSRDSVLALSKLKFSAPTPIQSAAIPHILSGHDVIGKAPTGSGKTLAFGLPICEYWLEQLELSDDSSDVSEPHPIALIILPTRELAHQITEHLEALDFESAKRPLKIATLTGGLSVQKQKRQLANADVVVCTPGRLWELIEEGQTVLAALKQIRFLVVDEADRLLSAGHFKELQQILEALDKEIIDDNGATTTSKKKPPQQRQTLVFSATFHKGLQQKLAKRTKPNGYDLLSNSDSMSYLLQKLNFREEKPKFVDINPTSQMVEGLREGLIECPRSVEKDLYTYALIALYYASSRTLVFVNSISAVRRLVPFLQNLNLNALGLHSQMPQKARLRSVERFTAATPLAGAVLIATDVAARGLDIPDINLVVHYHLPRAADTYVHRSGRTARAAQKGSSILMCAPEEVAGVRRLVAQVHSKSPQRGRSAKALFIQSLDIERRIVARLQPRVEIAKTLADAAMAREKKHSEDEWLRKGAEELGVEYDSEEFEREGAKNGRGRSGRGRKLKERESRSLSKAELQAMRAELKRLLAERLNVGVSARYLTADPSLDIGKLLDGRESSFLGGIPALGFDD